MISLASSKSILAFLFLSFTISTCGFDQSFHQPETPANTRLTIVVKDCEGVAVDENRMNFLQEQLAKRLDKNEVYYQNINGNLEKQEIILDIIKSKDETKSIQEIQKSLLKSIDLKLVTAVRFSDPVLNRWKTNMLENEEGIGSILDFNEIISGDFGKYPMAVLAVCKNENLPELKQLMTKYEKESGIIFHWGKNNQTLVGGVDTIDWLLYGYLKNETNIITSKNVNRASAEPDQYTGEIIVNINMDEKGGETFAAMTKKASVDNSREILIMVNEEVYSAPRVMSEITGGRCSISGNFSLKDAAALAALLEEGSLICDVEITKEDKIKD